MKLSHFLTDPRIQGALTIPSELDPFPLIITQPDMNRYSDQPHALTRICLAVIAMEGELPESDLLVLGRYACGLVKVFAARRMLVAYGLPALETMEKWLRQYQSLPGLNFFRRRWCRLSVFLFRVFSPG